jgi:hypothetical protein
MAVLLWHPTGVPLPSSALLYYDGATTQMLLNGLT